MYRNDWYRHHDCGNFLHALLGECWQPELLIQLGGLPPETAATATYPRFLQGSKESHQNYYLSDFWLKDGKYLRLKNVMISYTFDKKMLRKTPFSSLKIFASGFNLITWDKLKKVDPEVAPSSNTGYFYPQQRQYNMGINVSF